MKMFLVLLRSELSRLVRERPFRWALLIVTAAALLALANGVLRSDSEQRNLAAIAADDDARYDKLRADLAANPVAREGWTDLNNPGEVGLMAGVRSAVLPEGPLSVLSAGQRDVSPSAVRVSLRPDALRERYDSIENPRTLLIGPFDFVFVVVHLLPLMIFALGYDLVSGEREAGTLPLILAEPVSFGRVLVAKLAARMLAFLAVAAGLVTLGALLGGGSAAAGGQDIALPVAGALVTVLLYGAFWLLLMLAIQRLRRSSQTNALLALAAWLLLIVVVPAVLNAVVTSAYPLPARIELLEASRAAQRAALLNEDKALARYYEDHPGLAKPGEQAGFWKHWVIRNKQVEAALRPLEQRFSDQLEKQQASVEAFQAFSPAVTAHTILTDLAGGGVRRQRRFVAQAGAYNLEFRGFFEERVLHGERFGSDDVGRVPRFTFQEEPRTALLARLALHLGFLAIPALLLLPLAFYRLGRTRWHEQGDG